MNKADLNGLIAFPVLVIIGLLVALAGSQGGSLLGRIPLFAVSVGLIFLIQWLVFIPAYLLQSEKFFDLTGSITYIAVITLALIFSRIGRQGDPLWALVVIWASGWGFPVPRKTGKDSQMNQTLYPFQMSDHSGLMVTFTMAALVDITTMNRKNWIFCHPGLLVWIF
jgi:hypothetical protein